MADAPKDPAELVCAALERSMTSRSAVAMAIEVLQTLHDGGWRFIHTDDRRELISYRAGQAVTEEAQP